MKAGTTGGLLDQYKLLGAIIDTPWATRLDHKVARHVIDRYYPKHGNGRASLRYLERATGSSRSNITTSLRRLAAHGAIIMTRPGQGTRPTEFALNFEFPASGTVDVTSSNDVPSVPVEVTSSGHMDDTSSAASVPVGVTESYLLNPAYKAEIQIDRNDTRPPTAPPLADGLAATAAGGTAVEDSAASKPTFESLWRTYNLAKGKKEARAAWNALPPETDLAAVIESAAAWQESWAAQNKPNAPRFTLARWLKDERYDEDAPTGYQPKQRPAKPGSQKPDNPGKPRRAKATHAFAEGETRLEIIKADVVECAASSTLAIVATDEAGIEYNHTTFLEHHDPDSQEAGQRELGDIVHAAGLGQIEDSKELLGLEIVAVVEGGKLKFTAPLVRKPEPPPARSTPTLEEINAKAKADFDAWCEAEHEDAA